MQASSIVSYKNPFVFDHVQSYQFSAFADMSNFFPKTYNRSISIDVVGCLGFCEVFECKVVLIKMPGNYFFLMKSINGLPWYSNGE